MSIAFNPVGLKSRHKRTTLLKAWKKVINSGIFLGGTQVKKLESFLRTYLQVPYVKTVASGHDALLIAFHSLRLKPDDEVIVQTNAYPSIFPIIQAGCQVKLIDCDENGQISLASLKNSVTLHTKVVLLTHLYGNTGDIASLLSFCHAKKIKLIEDCAQSFGTTFQNKMTGTWGEIGCYSFYPSKNFGALGDGGAITTPLPRIQSYIEAAVLYGEKKRYQSLFVSGHSRLPELQAAGLLTYSQSLKKTKKIRQKIKQWYEEEIATHHLQKHIRLLSSHPESDPFIHLLVAEVTQRTQLQHYLQQHHIITLIHYPSPLHKVAAFKNTSLGRGPFPIAERLSKTCLSLPFHEYLTRPQIKMIIRLIFKFYAQTA